MVLPTGRNAPAGPSIGAAKSPFKTSAGAVDEVSMTPIILAMTIDFDNFINSFLLIIPLVSDDHTTQLLTRCPIHNPFLHAIGHVFFNIFI
jgi:hypothetical protein